MRWTRNSLISGAPLCGVRSISSAIAASKPNRLSSARRRISSALGALAGARSGKMSRGPMLCADASRGAPAASASTTTIHPSPRAPRSAPIVDLPGPAPLARSGEREVDHPDAQPLIGAHLDRADHLGRIEREPDASQPGLDAKWSARLAVGQHPRLATRHRHRLDAEARRLRRAPAREPRDRSLRRGAQRGEAAGHARIALDRDQIEPRTALDQARGRLAQLWDALAVEGAEQHDARAAARPGLRELLLELRERLARREGRAGGIGARLARAQRRAAEDVHLGGLEPDTGMPRQIR